MTPIEESMRALDNLVRSGKILYVGISDAPAWVVSQANTIADFRGWSPFIGIQITYSLIERTPERELLPMAHELDIGVTAWSPLGGGVLSGKYSNDKKQNNKEEPKRLQVDNSISATFVNERNLSITQEVRTMAQEINKTPSQVALNWIRQQNKDRGVIITIIGARTESQIKDNLGCLDFELNGDQLKRLNEKSRIQLGFPHDLYEAAKAFAYGKSLSLTDNHRAAIL